MKKMEDGYWERNTQIGKQHEALFKHNVRIVMERFNESGGYNQFGYDGREFVALGHTDVDICPTMAAGAQITTQRWNSPDLQVGKRDKNYLENICTEYLKKYVEIGREDLGGAESSILFCSSVLSSGHV
ncbi:unnamed protein product [Ranitomeya imitator]|uniref:MHC class I-like antigen recognition-like domain-containing protein n=1 Tax=Ranitomeya imitator TaxID=111125 RepID=A0ABN9LGS4_9NEOB|nr:unnamed protein product [Ranitomeya imitator]